VGLLADADLNSNK